VWGALLFAVFACGTLHRSWTEGQRYLGISGSLIDLWTEDLTLDHARTALLSSIFLVEMNLISAGWTWIGYAVRISFDIGLHCELGTWPPIEAEMRRCVWWCVYSCDWYDRAPAALRYQLTITVCCHWSSDDLLRSRKKIVMSVCQVPLKITRATFGPYPAQSSANPHCS